MYTIVPLNIKILHNTLHGIILFTKKKKRLEKSRTGPLNIILVLVNGWTSVPTQWNSNYLHSQKKCQGAETNLQFAGPRRAFLSSCRFSNAVEARLTSSVCSSFSYLQFCSFLLQPDVDDPALRSEFLTDQVGENKP